MNRVLTSIGFGICITATASAQHAPSIEARIQSTSISFSGGHNFTNAALIVSGPRGYHLEETAARGMPVFRLQTAGRIPDGLYSYTLRVATDVVVLHRSTLNNGRLPGSHQSELQRFTLSGSFRVDHGLIEPIGTQTDRDAQDVLD